MSVIWSIEYENRGVSVFIYSSQLSPRQFRLHFAENRGWDGAGQVTWSCGLMSAVTWVAAATRHGQAEMPFRFGKATDIPDLPARLIPLVAPSLFFFSSALLDLSLPLSSEAVYAVVCSSLCRSSSTCSGYDIIQPPTNEKSREAASTTAQLLQLHET